jgi:hypothetical protein
LAGNKTNSSESSSNTQLKVLLLLPAIGALSFFSALARLVAPTAEKGWTPNGADLPTLLKVHLSSPVA